MTNLKRIFIVMLVIILLGATAVFATNDVTNTIVITGDEDEQTPAPAPKQIQAQIQTQIQIQIFQQIQIQAHIQTQIYHKQVKMII